MLTREDQHSISAWTPCFIASRVFLLYLVFRSESLIHHQVSVRHSRMRMPPHKLRYSIYHMKFVAILRLVLCQRKSVSEILICWSLAHFSYQKSNLEASRFSRRPSHVPASQPAQPVHVMVFGYPPDEYSSMVEYFKSLGDATEPEPDKRVNNCFRIGYQNTADAVRAIGKNGDVIRGTFMIATKWAVSILFNAYPEYSLTLFCSQEPVHAEAALGSSFRQSLSGVTEAHSLGSAADTDETTQPSLVSSVQSIGTPMQLRPASSAFRKQTALSEPRPFPPVPTPLSGTVLPSDGIVQKVLKYLFNWWS